VEGFVDVVDLIRLRALCPWACVNGTTLSPSGLAAELIPEHEGEKARIHLIRYHTAWGCTWAHIFVHTRASAENAMRRYYELCV
jgi:hypothetical protein